MNEEKRMDPREKLQEIMREVFDDDSLELFDGMSAEDVIDWDSFSHIHLCAAVEKGFNIKLTTEQAIKAKTVADFLRIIDGKSF